jgi:hypothetical protein
VELVWQARFPQKWIVASVVWKLGPFRTKPRRIASLGCRDEKWGTIISRRAIRHLVCNACLNHAAHGYHSGLHQLAEEDRCATPRQRLRTRCPRCRRQSPFIINSGVIEAPCRFVWCRSHFGYRLLPVRSTTPAMRRRDRLAIEDRLLLRLGSNSSVSERVAPAFRFRPRGSRPPSFLPNGLWRSGGRWLW